MIELELEMTYRLDVRGPISANDGSPDNPRIQYWEMAHATLDGPRVKATSASPGNDWFTPRPGGYGRPHVRLPFLTHDGALVLLEYRGLIHATEAFMRAVEADTPTEWDAQYMRMSLTFETSSPRYEWLTQSLFLARGRLLGAKSIEYEVLRVK